MQYPRFILAKAAELLDQEILQRIKVQMKQKNFDDKIINDTRLVNINLHLEDGTITYEIISDYESEKGFDVAKARERGTRRHFIRPIIANVLVWIVGGFVKAFSKGHWVKGIQRSLIIRKTMDYAEPIVDAKLKQQTELLFNTIMGKN